MDDELCVHKIKANYMGGGAWSGIYENSKINGPLSLFAYQSLQCIGELMIYREHGTC